MVESKKDDGNNNEGPLSVMGLFDIDVIDDTDFNHLLIALGERGDSPSMSFAETAERTSILLSAFSRNQVREALAGVKDRLPEGVLEEIEGKLDQSDSLPDDSNNPLRELRDEEARRFLIHIMANWEHRTDEKKLKFSPLVVGKDLMMTNEGIISREEYDD